MRWQKWREECRLLGYKNLVRISQETHYVSATYQSRLCYVRFEVFTAVTMKNAVFLDVMPRGSRKNRHLGGSYRLQHQGDRNQRNMNNIFNLMMEVEVIMFLPNVLTRATRRHIPEDDILHNSRRERLKSYEWHALLTFSNEGVILNYKGQRMWLHCTVRRQANGNILQCKLPNYTKFHTTRLHY
jgi:hypothetical protein